MKTAKADQSAVGLDTPVWGARAIGKIVNKGERATFHLLEAGHLPATKIGDSWVSTPRALLARIAGEVA